MSIEFILAFLNGLWILVVKKRIDERKPKFGKGRDKKNGQKFIAH